MASQLVRYKPEILTFGVVILAVAVGVATRPLMPVDETRYLSVAWDMHQTNAWLVPTLNGVPYHHKPPLLFWAIRLVWLVFGVSEAAARLVAPAFGIGALLLTRTLGHLLWPGEAGRNAGRVAPLLVVASFWWMLFASLTMFDLVVAFFALLGWIGLAIALNGFRFYTGMFLVALSIGLGILAKGPVVFIYILPPALFAPAWRSPGQGAHWKRWYLSVFLAVMAGSAIGLAWALPAASAGGADYGRALLFGQTFDRVSNSFAHRRPFYWYLLLLPVLLFPWTLWPPAWRALAVWRNPFEPGIRFAAVGIAVSLAVFMTISGKQLHYLLPLVPLATLIIARGLTAPWSTTPTQRSAWPLAAALICLAVAVLSVGIAVDLGIFSEKAEWVEWLLQSYAAASVVLIGLAVAVLWATRNAGMATGLSGAIAVSLGLYFVAHLLVFSPAMRDAYDLKPMSKYVSAIQETGRPIAFAGDYAGEYNFLGRLKRPVEVLLLDQIRSWVEMNPEGVVVYLARGAVDRDGALFTRPQRGRTAVAASSAAFTKATSAAPEVAERKPAEESGQ